MILNRRSSVFAAALVLGLALVACSGGAADDDPQAGGAVGPQRIEGATEIVKFDPTTINPGDAAAESASCAAAPVVLGAYHCDLQAGGAAEPCFATGGVQIICDPDPVNGEHGQFIRVDGALPPARPPSPDQAVVFFVELDTGMTCAIRTGPEPVIIDSQAAAYDCDTPYTYLVGEGDAAFDKSAPAWSVVVYTLDPASGEATAADSPAAVRRAWIP